MNWKNIRVYNNSQNNAFEELVCQLARQEKTSGYKRFVRNGTPDGGVECFWELEDGQKIAWQAKYVFDIDGVIAEADRSYSNALKSHATMCKFVIAIPFDLPDPNYVKKGKLVKSALKKWEEKVAFWEEKAKKENKSVKVILWNSSELLQRMMKPENEGMRYYWFNNEEFTATWFHNQLESTINDLGPRYSPELNVQLEINGKFEYLRRSSKVYLNIQRIRKAFIKTGRNYVNEIIKANIYEQQGQEKLLRIIENVSEQLKMNEYKEMQLLAFECISDELKKIEDINHEISNIVFSRLSHDFYNSEFYKSHSEFENTIYEIEELIKGDWSLLNNPIMLVFGDAGTGKSHLLADVCKNVLKEGSQAILILGDYFISSANPKEQIKQLFQSNLSYSAILGTLNAIGQATGERIIFALDALNEGEGSLIWPKFLRGMIAEIKRFPWIGFVMSVRSDNMDEIVPEECKKEMVTVQHTGFEECVDEACDNFFEYYGINFNMPILSEEFCNALYLKLFCETFKKEENITHLLGLTDIFSGYLNHINKKLSATDRFQYEESINLVELCVQRVASKMADGNTYSLPYKDVLDEVNDCTKGYCQQNSKEYKNFLDALIKENIFKSGVRYGQKEKYVTFSYERMGDYFVLYYHLKQKREEETLQDYFQNSNYFKDIFDIRALGKRNVINMLSILLPEVYGTELLYCGTQEHISGYVIQGFLKSLIWRKNRVVDEGIITWLKYESKKNVNLRLMVIDEILPLCALPDNPLNSLFIHDNFLVNENNTKRDLWWNSHINERYEYHNPPIYRRLISWSLKSHNNQKLSSESRKLLGIMLSWFCTSNNRELRDNASKALVCIYREAPDEILTLLNMFQEVNDLYVIERLYAAMYGVTVYCTDKTIVQKISDYVLENIFRKEEVLPHILIRDYALGIVKYALWCGIYEGVSEIPTMISVPFRSKFPKRFPSQNTIDKLEEKYKTNKGFGYVVSSMDVGVGYGDFGRYIFKNALNRFEGIDDIEKMKRWMIKRTLQLGFNPEIHDSSIPGYFGRRGGRTERIGKKYQWIALYEILALIQDHYMVCPEYGEETATKFLGGADGLRVRNFDPTLLLRNTYIESYQQPQKSWYCDYDLLDADYDNQKWLTDEVNFQKTLIEFSDKNNRRWLALCNYPYWNEYRDSDKEEYSSKQRKVMNAHIQSILMKKTDIEKWKKWNQNYPQESIYAIKSFNCSSMFYKENYWNTEYEEIASNTDTEGWTELFINRKSTGILYANTSQRYIWEEEYDFSKEDAIAFDIPTKIIAEGIKIYDKGNIGAYYRDDMLVCYNPGIKEQSNHLLLIDRELLINWLEENDLCILWIVTIEKQILNGRQGAESFIEWQGYYTLEDGNLEGKLEAVRNKGLPKENKRTEEVVKSEISTISSEGNENQPDVADVLSKYLGRPLSQEEMKLFEEE